MPTVRGKLRIYLAIAGPILALLLTSFLFIGLLNLPSILFWPPLRIGTTPALALLYACRLWYLLLLATGVFGPLLTVAACVFTFVSGVRGKIPSAMVKLSIYLMVFSVFLEGLSCYGILFKEKVPSLLVEARQDIQQLEEGRTEQVTVWLSPKTWPYRLPGPYTKGQPYPATRYGGISFETEGEWVWFYIPKGLDFSLDPEHLYDETQNIVWNEANAQQYLLTYTTNFRLVVSAEPVSGPG